MMQITYLKLIYVHNQNQFENGVDNSSHKWDIYSKLAVGIVVTQFFVQNPIPSLKYVN
jgi:hypothetical protein